MILVDVGNSTIHFALAKGNEIVKQWGIPTATATLSQIKTAVRTNQVIACSVVPQITDLFKKISNTKIIGEDIKVPIKCHYNKSQIGQDRLVAAYAAHKIYPGCRIVIDFGTAITFDFLSRNGDYEGGIILPGIGSTLRTLSTCAMLPKHLKLKSTRTLIPKNTQESISRGVDLGFSLMLQGLIDYYIRTLKISGCGSIVITGGEGFFIAKNIESEHILDTDLIFKGLIHLSNA
jgi:type III pantothenate kinase